MVVVSPTTLPEPPAFDAATMAARYPIWTLRWNTAAAMVPPMSAAAMLSRNDDNTKIITSSTRPPLQSSGRSFGNHSGTRLVSKCFDNSAKPSNSPSKLVNMTHSCARCCHQPRTPVPAGNGEKPILYSEMTIRPASAMGSVWW